MHISARTQFFRELAIDSKFDMDRLIMIPIYQNKNNVFIQCRPYVDPQFFFLGGGKVRAVFGENRDRLQNPCASAPIIMN